ncbi:MAG: homocysteine biosynthesis protein, partial [Candidatus Desulforudis sp.]|nr:homocysteine biosynthesis protein [Desulforudis sp.]
RTYADINARLRKGNAVVVTAEEVVSMVKEQGLTETARQVDVVTTGTFSPMCSSGVYLNFGHSAPRIKGHRITLNDVPAYGGLAAVDTYLGATAVPDNDPLNSSHPGEFRYGGGHVIHDLAAGKSVKLQVTGHGTDCYPRREIETYVTLDDLNEVVLFNPRNAYQNYNVAVNQGDRTLYTYMGVLKSHLGNAHYSTSGQLSPLLKDPYFRTLGIGTRIFLGGGVGHIVWNGTQHFPSVREGPVEGSLFAAGGTLTVLGDLKQMRPQWLIGASILGYGATLVVGIGVPIPILDEDVLRYAALSDEQLYAPVVDYSTAYPQRLPQSLGLVSYAALKSGTIEIEGREVPTAPMSSYTKAREIAGILKEWLLGGEFFLSEPVQLLPSPHAGLTGKPLEIRGAKE